LLACAVALAAGLSAFAADETFQTLAVGNNTFTNVIVMSKTRSNVFISHSKGMMSVKVKDLDPATQLKLGYQLEQPKGAKMQQLFKTPDISRLESNPQVQELQTRLTPLLEEWTDRIDDRILYGFVGAVVFIYLLFCSLCRSICMKAAVAPMRVIPLIWLPLFKQIPMFKAAGMSSWWILSNFVPGLFLVAYIVWSFKIVQARAKHVTFAVLLLLPVANLFSFLYLALSSGSTDSSAGARNIISLQNAPRREAA